MPPRITRNSPRPRASDRTMVDLESPSLVALANSTAPLTHQRNLSEWTQVTLLQASLITVGWISRKPLPSGRGRSFFLTSLLIELIEKCLIAPDALLKGLLRPRLADARRFLTLSFR